MNVRSETNLSAELQFDNRFVNELPADPESSNELRQVHGACYSEVQPTAVSAPKLIAYSREMAENLGLSQAYFESEEFAQVFAGNQMLPGMQPYAMCYGGHQFGNWAGQLGDGRAINLGEVIGADSQRWALQLKGAGLTPYSRRADGLAVLRSSVREFLCSEAMFHLGVPTTRALSLVLTGEQVVRDMFYDGRPEREPGAIVCRVAPSFVRFGSFEIFASREEHVVLQQLMDHTIRTDFPHLGEPSKGVYLQWFEEICRRTAEMIVHWMRVGFVHGVMNTDNMSILGLTIDYGPYGWLEDFDPDWTPNTTDANGRRYRYGHQPQISHWNLAQLANALHPVVQDAEALTAILSKYESMYYVAWQNMMAQKLGFQAYKGETDGALFVELLEILSLVETDMTIFFRKLADVDTQAEDLQRHAEEMLACAYYLHEQFDDEYAERLGVWLRHYSQRLRQDNLDHESRRAQMNAVNPKYVLRNYLAQMAIDQAAEGDFSLVEETLDVLRRPYTDQPGKEAFAEKRPEWARHRPGCSMLSCSS